MKRVDKDYERSLKQRFGMSIKDYERILAAQGGGCALCGRLRGKYRLNLDHDHVTGQVRGILCAPCNRFLAVVDGVDGFVDKLRAYLEQTRDARVASAS